jgi:coenzyme F420-0:L-glutamate ligase/coenzyme F420-1:gamma-L-glutamate ligase
MTIASRVELLALPDFPAVRPGDDLSSIIVAALDAQKLALRSGDVVAVAQKVVSKAENRYVDLSSVSPSERAREIALEIDKDARLVEIILSESTRVVRKRRDLLIVEHRLGFVMANAGVDQSNIENPDSRVLLLPRDPDASAEELRTSLSRSCGCQIAVVINDSVGRAWRRGTVGIAIGAAGLPSLLDLRGVPDLFGRVLRTSMVGLADEIAAAASLVMGQAGEGRPVVVVRGLNLPKGSLPGKELIRPEQDDLFR